MLLTKQKLKIGLSAFALLLANCNGGSLTNLSGGSSADTDTPPSGVTDGAVKVWAGQNHTCSRTQSEAMKCWGSNSNSQINSTLGITVLTATTNSRASGATTLSLGGGHTCSLTTTTFPYAPKCWGLGTYGQLGNAGNVNSVTPASVSGLSSSVSAIAAGYWHTCALLTSGAIKCWGDGDDGKLGNGATADQNVPVDVSSISTAKAIAVGWSHSCALLLDKTMSCWGSNLNSKLGDGGTTNQSTPVTVVGVSDVAAIATGREHTCALLVSGAIKCWGNNGSGQLGDGTQITRSSPITVPVAPAMAIAAGYDHTCALLTTGYIYCWGSNTYGQVGSGSSDTAIKSPAVVGGLSGASELAAGESHTCARLTNGFVKCWGHNGYGQLGNNSTTQSNLPVYVQGF